MKFSLKAASVATALALSAIAGTAQAAGGNPTDIYVVVYDPTSGLTFEADAGPVATTGPTSNINLSSFTAWSTFVADATGASSTWDFAILGGSSGTGAGDISQLASEPVTAGTYANTDLENIYTLTTSVYATSLGTANSVTAASTATNSFVNTIFDGGAGDAGSGVGGSIFATGTGTGALDLYYQTSGGADSLLASATLNVAGNAIDFSTAAAVPEPGTYGLMMAGLVAVGAIVRRRTKA
jgi:hypothetical protein